VAPRFITWDAGRSISVLAWADSFDRAWIQKFERETGITVCLNYCTTNEELFVKLRTSGGTGYDVIVLSDYAVRQLGQEGLLKQLDKTRLPFFSKINPALMGHSFDPQNNLAVPFSWTVYCIGLNKKYIDQATVTDPWDLVFTPYTGRSDYRVIMINDPLEAISFASQYLYGPDVTRLSDEQLIAIRALLCMQKGWVEAYTNIMTDYTLGSGAVQAAVMQSSDAWRAAKKYAHVDYLVPPDALVSIEHCAIPVGSKKEALAYEFLNYMYTPESCIHHFNTFLMCPARLDIIPLLSGVTQRQRDLMSCSPAAFSNYSFIRDLVSEQQRYDLWVVLKS